MHVTRKVYRWMPGLVKVSAGSALGMIGACVLASCQSPLVSRETDAVRASIVESARRELTHAEARPEASPLDREPTALNFPADRLAELEAMGGVASFGGSLPELGKDLLNQEAALVRVDLAQALTKAVRQNLDVERARLDPAIREADAVAADAAFDWVFFADLQWNAEDEPRVTPVFGGTQVGAAASQSQSVGYSTGIRKRLTSGGTLEISQGQDYQDQQTPNSSFSPDPSNLARLSLTYTQPLLRGFGSEVALAEVRLTRNAERRAVHAFKAQLLATVTSTETAYWRLVQAYRRLQIAQRLLERGVETREVLRSRLEFDARPAEFSDAVATVERRRGDVLRAVNTLRQASDTLKALINDDELTVGSEAVLLPADEAIDQAISFSLLDALTSALDHRPEVQQAILEIDDAAIRQSVADSDRLPLLDFTFQSRFQGLDRDAGEAYGDVGEGRFVNLLLGLAFEQPLGNRPAEAAYRARQLERLRATVEYRRVVQAVVLDVKTALRDAGTNYKLIEQTRASRLAAAENLRTLLVQEQTIQSLTPDFLDLKFRRQDALAQAERDELAALVDYNIALAELERARGTALERSRIRLVVPDSLDPGAGRREGRRGSE